MNQNKQAPRRRMTRREWRIRRCLRLARNWAVFLAACGAAVALMTSGILWLLPKAHALIAGPEAFVARNYDGTEYQLNLADARLVLVCTSQVAPHAELLGLFDRIEAVEDRGVFRLALSLASISTVRSPSVLLIVGLSLRPKLLLLVLRFHFLLSILCIPINQLSEMIPTKRSPCRSLFHYSPENDPGSDCEIGSERDFSNDYK